MKHLCDLAGPTGGGQAMAAVNGEPLRAELPLDALPIHEQTFGASVDPLATGGPAPAAAVLGAIGEAPLTALQEVLLGAVAPVLPAPHAVEEGPAFMGTQPLERPLGFARVPAGLGRRGAGRAGDGQQQAAQHRRANGTAGHGVRSNRRPSSCGADLSRLRPVAGEI